MMEQKELDYTDMVIMDMYTILTTHKNPWPTNFTKLKKLEFMDKIIEYLKDNQKYEECGVLTKMRERIANEPIGKGKAPGK